MLSAEQTVPPVTRIIEHRTVVARCPRVELTILTLEDVLPLIAAVEPNPTPPVAQTGTNISPDTAVTNWSSAPVTDWPATPTSFARREALVSISKICPKINKDILLLALEEHNFNVNDAVDLLTGTGMDDAMTTFLTRVFPGVPRVTIEIEVAECYGKYLNVFSRMVMKYHSYWKPHPDPTTSALSLSPPARYRPDFIADGLEEETTEAAWWKTLADTVRWQVEPPAPNELTWRTIVSACHLTHKSYSPRLAGLVSNLSGPDREKALAALRVLPAYSAMVDLASNDLHRALCLSTVTALAANGVTAPGAIAWAFEMSSDNPAENFVLRHAASTYSKTSSTIWLARNKAMLAHRQKSFNAPVDPIVVDDAEDGFSVRDVPVSPTVSRITRTSAGSKRKGKANPYSKPVDKKRASDDDVRAAEPWLKGKEKAQDIIELTSDLDANADSSHTMTRLPSPVTEVDENDKTATVTPKPVIMSPSIVSPRKTIKKTAPTRKSPVKTRSKNI